MFDVIASQYGVPFVSKRFFFVIRADERFSWRLTVFAATILF